MRAKEFLSTPSGWRATRIRKKRRTRGGMISIHALRVEGDKAAAGLVGCALISIHALRVEGDAQQPTINVNNNAFLSTPSGWRATMIKPLFPSDQDISIHALRVEGDTVTKKQR